VRTSLTRWKEMAYDCRLLMRKYLHLQQVSTDRAMRNGFKGLRINFESWRSAAKTLVSRWHKALLDAAAQLFIHWRNRYYFDRKTKKVLALAFARNDDAAKFKAFDLWLSQQRRTKRMDRQVDVWDQRDETHFFDGWLALVLQRKDKCVRAWLKCLRSDAKLCNQVFLFWAYFSSSQRTRRIKVIKMRGRMDSSQLRCVFGGLVEVITMLRRRRLLLAKTTATFEKCRILNAAEKLLENSKTRLRHRRVFRMLLNRHQTKTVQHAWGEWEMRLESKRRMTLAYHKALQMD